MDNIFLSGSPSNINIVNANEIRISGQKNAIQIQQAKGEIVSIYSVSGQLIKKIIIPSDNIQITVNQGYYLVKTAKGTVKTVVF
jgi:ribosomal protein L13